MVKKKIKVPKDIREVVEAEHQNVGDRAREFIKYFGQKIKQNPDDYNLREAKYLFRIIWRLSEANPKKAEFLYERADEWTIRRAESYAKDFVRQSITGHPYIRGVVELTKLLNNPRLGRDYDSRRDVRDERGHNGRSEVKHKRSRMY